MEKCYTLKGQSLENGLSCIFQATGKILTCRESSRIQSYEHFVVCKGFTHADTCTLDDVPEKLEDLPLTKQIMTREMESISLENIYKILMLFHENKIKIISLIP